MKQHSTPEHKQAIDAHLQALAHAFTGLQQGQILDFLRDLCTPAELEAMADRWRVVPLLHQGVPYRKIHQLTGVSVTTISRVARSLEHGTGGYARVLANLNQNTPAFI